MVFANSNPLRGLLIPLSGLLLWASWPLSPSTPLVFIAFLPLLLLERQLVNGARFFWIVLLNMFIWNAGTTWWIWNSTGPGAAGAIIANSLLMCFPWMAFRFTRRNAGELIGYSSLIAYWIAFEYLHHRWELSWPWLTLGNVFSNRPGWVQWYEYTGTTGGSLWVLAGNVALLQLMLASREKPVLLRKTPWVAALLVLPALLSFFLTPPDAEKTIKTNAVVVQPNVEPYEEKFNTPPAQLVQSLIALSESQIDSNTRLVAWPETAIPAQAWEHNLPGNEAFQPVFEMLRRHPQVLLVTGIDSYKLWGADNPGGLSIRQMNNGQFYEAFNTAMGTDSNLNLQLYHKAKLVPGVEALPSWLGFLGDLFDDFGGTSGTLGRSDSAEVFTAIGNPYRAAPIICYESIYADYVSSYVRLGANVLAVITNDGWWGNTPGHRQHMAMSRLRAIENRRWVVRSANTGISCFINPAGEVLDAQPWEKQAAIRMPVEPLDELTFFAEHGDWMSRLLWPMAFLLFAYALVKRIMHRRNRL